MDSLREKLSKLHLKVVSQHLEQVLKEAKDKNLSILAVLQRLADLELEYRWQAAIKLRFTQARLPESLTIDQFDFNHHKSRKEQKERILSLLDLEFVREKMDVILIGNPGTGKTFIAQSLGFAACNANLRVLFTSAMDMINHLAAAEADHSLLRKLQHYRSGMCQ
jgi:DNA replication protein DnaC